MVELPQTQLGFVGYEHTPAKQVGVLQLVAPEVQSELFLQAAQLPETQNGVGEAHEVIVHVHVVLLMQFG